MKSPQQICTCLQHNNDFVSFANMGHGETVFIKFGNQTFLRDFGEWKSDRKSDNDCTVNRIIFTDKNCEFHNAVVHDNCTNYNAILSHPHKDHFSGFYFCFELMLKNKISTPLFEHAYIPRLISGPEDVLLAQKMYECAVILQIFTEQEEYNVLSANFINFAPIMQALSKQLHHCYADHPNLPFRCLLPEISIVSTSNRKTKKTAQSCLDNFYQKNSFPETVQTEIQKTVNSIWENVFPYLGIGYVENNNSMRDDTNIQEKAASAVKTIQDSIKKLKQDIKKYSINPRTKVSDIFDYLKEKLDDASLTFDISPDEDNECGYWLFLGDNGEAALESIHKELKKHYFGIKAAHHGTRVGSGFSLKTHSDVCVCCTGEGHPNLLPIEQEYIGVSEKCYAIDVPQRCKKTCMESRKINVLCNPLVKFNGGQPAPPLIFDCKGCPK